MPGGQRAGDPVQQRADLAVDDDRVEAFLAAEVLVDHRLGHLRPGPRPPRPRCASKPRSANSCAADAISCSRRWAEDIRTRSGVCGAGGRGWPVPLRIAPRRSPCIAQCPRSRRSDVIGMASRRACAALACERGPALGQRTSGTQPNFSKARSAGRRCRSARVRTPCRAQVGSAWCRLCQLSPKDRMASGQKLRPGRLAGLERALAVHVADRVDRPGHVVQQRRPGPGRPRRTRVSAPRHDQVTSPPISGRQQQRDARSRREQLVDPLDVLVGEQVRGEPARLVSSRWNSQPMCAKNSPWSGPGTSRRTATANAGRPRRRENAWCLRWSATHCVGEPWIASEPGDREQSPAASAWP